MKVDPDSGGILLCLWIGAVLLHEKLRPGQAEAVNALLHVPYHKDIWHALSLGHAVQDHLLEQVAVLVLVDHDLHIAASQLPGRVRHGEPEIPAAISPEIRSGLLLHVLHQDLQGQVLQIRKIRQIFQPFLLLIAVREFRRQPQKLQRRRSRLL